MPLPLFHSKKQNCIQSAFVDVFSEVSLKARAKRAECVSECVSVRLREEKREREKGERAKREERDRFILIR